MISTQETMDFANRTEQSKSQVNCLTVEEIEKQDVQVDGTEIVQVVPTFGLLSKITPIFIVFSIYAFISFLNPLVGILGGVVYSILKKIRPE